MSLVPVVPDVTLYGYLDHPVHLECRGFSDKLDLSLRTLEWRKCEDDRCWDTWKTLVYVEYTNPEQPSVSYLDELKHRPVTFSRVTGDLTIHSLEEQDRGLYKCDTRDVEPVHVRILIYGKHCIAS